MGICQEILQFLEGDFVKPKNKDEKRKFGFELVEAPAFSLLRKFSKLRKFGHLDLFTVKPDILLRATLQYCPTILQF